MHLACSCGQPRTLPSQLIYEGKTDLSTPGGQNKSKTKDKLPAREQADRQGHDVTFSETHWMVPRTYIGWFEKIVLPDIKATCERLGLVFGNQVRAGAALGRSSAARSNVA